MPLRFMVAASIVALTTALLADGLQSEALRPPGGRLKTVDGRSSTVATFESVVTGAMQKARVTGISCAILNDGKIAYTRAFGWKDKDTAAPLDAQTAFVAASLSKPVFAYLVMVLAEEGVIDLDKPLQGYLEKPLPEYSKYGDLSGDSRHSSITARMVLSHTTGLPNLRAFNKGRLNLLFEPGRRFSYSGEAIDLLQMVVEQITKKDLETLARERIFTPFGMARTSYVWREEFAKNVALPHNEYEWPDDPQRWPVADAAGSMTTTANDYARFLARILTASGRHKQSMERMLSPTIWITSERMFGSRSQVDTDANGAIRLAWGLGWGSFETPHGRAFFHTGRSSGAQNYVVTFLDRGIGIVLLSNSDNFESVAREIVAAGIGDTYSPFEWLGYVPFDPARRKVAPPRRVAIQVAADVIAPYAGTYQLGSDNVFFFVKTDGGRIYASDDEQSWDEVFAESDTLFFFKGRNLTLTFVKDTTGNVTRVDIDLEGKKMSAQRIR